MEEQIKKIIQEFKKINKFYKNTYRSNASGVKRIAYYGRDKELGKHHKRGVPCNSITFGSVQTAFAKKGTFVESRWNEEYKDLYQSVLELAPFIIPEDFVFHNITANKNFACLPHYDKNKGNSIIIGFGDYTGGRLKLHHKDDEIEYVDIKNKPYQFNGKKIKHSVEQFIGDRYSLVYYCK